MVEYCTALMVKDVSKVTYSQLELADDAALTTLIETLIGRAERLIDDHCGVPSTFFKAAGLAISNELHDSEGDGEVLTDYHPIITVTKLEANNAGLSQAANWTQLTEGPGASTHFIAYKRDGLIHIYNGVPASGHQNIRISYTAGYSVVPKSVEQVCVEVVARMLESFVNRVKTKMGELGEYELRLVDAKAFSEELKKTLTPYVHVYILRG